MSAVHDTGMYVQCEVCGERALLPWDSMTLDRFGRRVTVRELMETETAASAGAWRCPRHPLRENRKANGRYA